MVLVLLDGGTDDGLKGVDVVGSGVSLFGEFSYFDVPLDENLAAPEEISSLYFWATSELYLSLMFIGVDPESLK